MRLFFDGTRKGSDKRPVWVEIKNIDYVTQELRTIFALKFKF